MAVRKGPERVSHHPTMVGDNDRCHMLVLPPVSIFDEETHRNLLEQLKEKHFTLLFICDGNERAGGNYKEGGQKVVAAATEIAKQHPEVTKAVFCILSQDNIDKRDDDFLRKMLVAFLGLGIKISDQEVFIPDGIELTIEGDLGKLRKKSPVGRQLADMIEASGRLTQGQTKTGLTAVFGIGYDEKIAEKHQVDCLVRTGMEEEGIARTSGIEVPKAKTYIQNGRAIEVPVPVIGTTTLWSLFDVKTIGKALALVKEPEGTITTGYTSDETVQLSKALVDEVARIQAKNDATLITVTIPFTGSIQPGNEINHAPFIQTQPDVSTNQTYSMFIAPNVVPTNGHTTFYLPRGVEKKIGYVNVIHATTAQPKDIAVAIERATIFHNNNIPLQGAGRDVSQREKEKAAAIQAEIAEFEKLQIGLNALKGDKGVIDLNALESLSERTGNALYEEMADNFVGVMMPLAQEIGLTAEDHPSEFLAFINYAYTPAFMMYTPNHPRWNSKGASEGLSREWQDFAEIATLYEQPVGAMDYLVFDVELPEKEKERLVTFATHYFTNIINNKMNAEVDTMQGRIGTYHNANFSKAFTNTINIGKVFQKLRDKITQTAHKKLLENWQSKMTELFFSHLAESQKNQKSTEIPDESTPNVRKAPTILSERKKTLVTQGREGNKQNIELLDHLYTIEQSIGSGLIFHTLASYKTKGKEVKDETIEELNEICSLLNIFIRIANDLAEITKAKKDQEKKKDCISILMPKHKALIEQDQKFADASEGVKNEGARIKTYSELHGFMKEVEAELQRKLHSFHEKYKDDLHWERVAIGIKRGIAIGQAFYKDRHYKTTLQGEVYEIMREHQSIGLDA